MSRAPRKRRVSEPGASNYPDDRSGLRRAIQKAYLPKPPDRRRRNSILWPSTSWRRTDTRTFTSLPPTARLLFRVKSDLNVGENLLTGPLKGSELAEVFERSKMLLQSEVSDYQVYPGLTEPAVFIAHPVFTGGAVIGVVVLQLGNQADLPGLQRLRGAGRDGGDSGGSQEG